MIFIFRNGTIFWDISKWNRGQKKWDGGSIYFEIIKMRTLNHDLKHKKEIVAISNSAEWR